MKTNSKRSGFLMGNGLPALFVVLLIVVKKLNDLFRISDSFPATIATLAYVFKYLFFIALIYVAIFLLIIGTIYLTTSLSCQLWIGQIKSIELKKLVNGFIYPIPVCFAIIGYIYVGNIFLTSPWWICLMVALLIIGKLIYREIFARQNA